FEIANRRELNVTPNPARDSNGRLTADGKHLVFTSSRATGNHLYVVSLEQLMEDPDDPLVRAQQAQAAQGGRGNNQGGRGGQGNQAGQGGRGGQGGQGGQGGGQTPEPV